MNRYIAITRTISERFRDCELTHIAREPIDMQRAVAQHEAYENALRALDVSVVRLPAEPSLPDSVFVEDCAVVLDECAIITRPGAASRRAETATVAAALRTYRALHFIETPGTIDGGDVLCVGQRIYIGLGTRSNADAIDQLRKIVVRHGYSVSAVPLRSCLHLKSAVTRVGESTLLINPAWVDKSCFQDVDFIAVDPAEPAAANAVLIGSRVLFPAHFPATRARLVASGISPRIVHASEVAKAEGAVSCCSLVFEEKIPDRLRLSLERGRLRGGVQIGTASALEVSTR
ncbi:MAG: dimethylargininase [Gammaproteobacteria bacterium]|nr:dimethylargininase [Gammaproteobacteria bacterium]